MMRRRSNVKYDRDKARKRGKRFKIVELRACPACGSTTCEGRFSFAKKEESNAGSKSAGG